MERGILYFYTATALRWQNLFKEDTYKDIIVNSLKYLIDKRLIVLYGIVIMPNHIHMLLEIPVGVGLEKDIQHSFMSFTAHEFKKKMKREESGRLVQYYVNDSDREYQFWERNPKIKEIPDSRAAGDIIDYIHCNPLQEKWNLVKYPEDYHYSSADFYAGGEAKFDFLTHYMDYFNRV